MYILVSHDAELGIVFEGKFDTHKEAYQAMLKEIEDCIDNPAIKIPTIEDYPFNSREYCEADWFFISVESNSIAYDIGNGVVDWQIFEV